MRTPDRAPLARTISALVLAVVLGGIGVVLAWASRDRPELRALVVMMWLASIGAFVAACAGGPRPRAGSPRSEAVPLPQDSLGTRAGDTRRASTDPGGLSEYPDGRAALPRVMPSLGTRHLVASATIGLAFVITILAVRAWVLVPLAIVAWGAAAAVLKVHWRWLLAAAVACLAASVLSAIPGVTALSDDLAVVSYSMAWISCCAAGIGRLREWWAGRSRPERSWQLGNRDGQPAMSPGRAGTGDSLPM